MTKKRYKSQTTNRWSRTKPGSALIIAVILTSLLAIIGMMFLMIARVDKMSTSAISGKKDLDSAAETVVAKISQELVSDVPGVAGQEYYDYPDACNVWLASLEPYDDGTSKYYWRRISDIYNRFGPVESGLEAAIIPDYQKPSDVGNSDSINGYPADADGDGVADSNWVIIPDMNSNKGKSIYAAIRVVDNGAMLNVNTAYKFDPNSAVKSEIDGSSQLQINLEALAKGSDTIADLADARNPLGRPLSDYLNGLVWRIEDPCSDYRPFDISDELELRNRGFIDSNTFTRLEEIWTKTFLPGYPTGHLRTPYDTPSDLPAWFTKASDGSSGYYTRRHICTTYNLDRIIDPCGWKMININTDVNAALCGAIKSALGPGYPNVDAVAAQMAVNLKDYRDGDSDVTYFVGADGVTRYGFENQPFISEIAAFIDLADPTNNSFYALELYNPFNKSISLNDFVLTIDGMTDIFLSGTINPNGYFVISNDLTKFNIAAGAVKQQDLNLKFSGNYQDNVPAGGDGIWDTWSNYNITLKRTVGGTGIILDHQITDNIWFRPPPPLTPPAVVYYQRDTGNWHVVYQTPMNPTSPGSLGSSNTPIPGKKNYNLSLANDKLVTVGDIARVLIVGPSTNQNDTIGARLAAPPSEDSIRLDLQNAVFQQLFEYLTVFDPNSDGIDNDGDGTADNGELKVPGRININTAPWFVLAQLPWVSQRVGYNNLALAQAIVAYRDKLNLSPVGPDYSGGRGAGTGIVGLREEPGFASIGELAAVINNSNKDIYSMNYYILGAENGIDLPSFPDLTTPDGPNPPDVAIDDFEERDVIFARISNLVTVRSDVFTAYILVRIGKDGPQKRVMAILDRSSVRSPADKVRIIALHPIPDPR